MKIKKIDPGLPDPSVAYEYDAGIDLYSREDYHFWRDGDQTLVGSGIAVEIPRGNVGFVIIRSSCSENGLTLANGIGVIDSGYRGEIMMPLLWRSYNTHYAIKRGQKIAQLVVVKLTFGGQHIEIVDELSPSDRGEAGFGSSDNN